jgi:uncharacterized protein (TIGR02453 family)
MWYLRAMRDPIPSTNLLKDIPDFTGFSPKAQSFLTGLTMNNEKVWFDAHRTEYETYLLQPMRAFVVAVGQQLRPLMPKVVADPRVGGSVFRMARDIRFSTDKSPYKTWAAARWWDSGGPSKETSAGYYFHIEAKSAYVGGGIYMFEDDQLDRYRKALDDPRTLRALRTVITKMGDLEILGASLKRVPRGFAPDHPAGDLLRHKGIYAGRDIKSKALRTAGAVAEAFALFKQILPLNQWLMQHVVGSPGVRPARGK